MSRIPRRIAIALGMVTTLLLAGCAGGGEDDTRRITVWTGDTLPDRVAAIQAIIGRFTQQTGVQVELVGVDEDQFNQLQTAAAAAGDLPDVVGAQPLAAIRTLAANDLVDTAATAAVVEALGADTFDQRALELTRDGTEQLAVPSEARSQLLYYARISSTPQASRLRRPTPRSSMPPAPSTNPASRDSPVPPRPATRSPSRPSSTSRSMRPSTPRNSSSSS